MPEPQRLDRSPVLQASVALIQESSGATVTVHLGSIVAGQLSFFYIFPQIVSDISDTICGNNWCPTLSRRESVGGVSRLGEPSEIGQRLEGIDRIGVGHAFERVALDQSLDGHLELLARAGVGDGRHG